jgi:polyisoprenyl-phosphate glycosyltransferase
VDDDVLQKNGSLKMNILYLVIPCHNEEKCIPETAIQLSAKLSSMVEKGICSKESRILFIDNGSYDQTWPLIVDLFNNNGLICGLKLTNNFGHQNALLAGLITVKEFADCTISMDADLQDDIEVIDQFLEKYHNGCEVVYGVRKKRKSDTFFKRNAALLFYKLMKALGVNIIYNHADYRLLGRNAVNALADYREVNLFLRGIIPLIGYKTDVVYYDRNPRYAGESKYPFRKLLSFAMDGITSFSVKPLKMISNLGILISILSVLALIFALVCKLLRISAPGWFGIVVSIWLLGGIQLFCIGVLGEYIGKIFKETKQRPRFHIDIFLNK